MLVRRSIVRGYGTTQMQTLRIELVSLIHHIELHKDGWWDAAIQRIVLAGIWLLNKEPTVDEIRASLRKRFAIELARQKPRTRWGSCSAPEISVRQRFAQLVGRHCPSTDPGSIWQDFYDHLLIPLIKELGAGTYELITGSTPSVPETQVGGFLDRHPKDLRLGLQQVISELLDPNDAHMRGYVLGLLNSYFFVEATRLSKNTLARIRESMAKPPSFRVFCDSNVIFSLIGLHDNPANEAASFVRNLISQVGRDLDVKLFALDVTLDETRNAIAAKSSDLDTIDWSNPFAAAVADNPSLGYSGLAGIYVRARAKANEPVSAKVFFGEYISDLSTIVQTDGIEPFYESAVPYVHRHDAEVDIERQLASARKRSDGRKGKSERELRHDIPLWYFVHDKRPAAVDSPLDAQYWVVTEDFWLIWFARYKASWLHERIPVCIHPSTLTQLLEFWVPRSPELESAMLSSLRLPMLFSEFDPTTERITTRILQTLSHFENSPKLGSHTIAKVLGSQALRQRIAETDPTAQGAGEREHEAEERFEDVQTALREEMERREKLESELVALRSTIEDSGRIAQARAEAAGIRLRWVVIPAMAVVVVSVLIGGASAALLRASLVATTSEALLFLIGVWLWGLARWSPRHAMEDRLLTRMHRISRPVF